MIDPAHWVALRHRNFRLLWFGQLVSFSGSMMQSAAVLWHVALLVPPEDKGMALGLVGLARLVPLLGLSLVSGVVADAMDRRLLMLLTQSAMTIASLALAVLTFRGLESTGPIYLLTALGFAAGAFDAPARQALVPNLVPREHLPNAISLNTIMFHLAAVSGPAAGGLVIAGLDLGWAYLLNAASFLAVIASLLLMRDVKEPPREDRPPVSLGAALEGLRFVFTRPLIRSTMLLDFFATLFASATALLPIFAQDVLQVGARGYGWLSAAPAVGSVLTSLALARHAERIDRRGRVLLVAVAIYGLATIAFGLSTAFWLTFASLMVVGAADTVSTVLRNLIRQLETPDHLRGRMTSVNMIFFMGGPQLGEVEAGAVASWIGAPLSVVTGGLGTLAATAWFAVKEPALRAYRR